MKRALMVTICLAASFVFAADVEVKYSGPSGQGTIIYWSPATGTTNMILTRTGVSNLVTVGSVSLPTDSVDPTDIKSGTLDTDVVARAFSNATANVAFSNSVSGGTVIRYTALPTSTNGLQSGSLWNSNSVVSIMP